LSVSLFVGAMLYLWIQKLNFCELINSFFGSKCEDKKMMTKTNVVFIILISNLDTGVLQASFVLV